MDRLTRHTPDDFGYAEYQLEKDADEQEVISKLAAYEDTGLTVGMFESAGATNYLTVTVDYQTHHYGITIQKDAGKTPQEEIASLRADLETVLRERDAAITNSKCGCGICLAHNGMVCPKMRGASEQEAT